MTTEQKQTKLSKWYEMLEDCYSRQSDWVRNFGKEMSAATYTSQLSRLLESRINQVEGM